MIAHSAVGFKPKKFELVHQTKLVHQTVFLVRDVVWAQNKLFYLAVTRFILKCLSVSTQL